MDRVGEGYQRVAALSELPEGGTLAVELAGRPLVLVKRGERVHALDDTCPHRGAPLSEGLVEGDLLTCAWHGWSFHLATGASAENLGASVPCHEVRIVDDDVLVKL